MHLIKFEINESSVVDIDVFNLQYFDVFVLERLIFNFVKDYTFVIEERCFTLSATIEMFKYKYIFVVLQIFSVLNFLSLVETLEYFHVVLFIMLYKVVLTFKSVDETLVCDHSNESY